MNTAETLQIDSTSSEQTEQIGRKLGAHLRGGEVIELASDLGGGKTTFVRGLAAGAGSHDSVGSPSFTISREYAAGELTIHHYDFYRLSEPGVMLPELQEVLQDSRAVAVIEWAGAVDEILPADRLRIVIAATGGESRRLDIAIPSALQYLKEGL